MDRKKHPPLKRRRLAWLKIVQDHERRNLTPIQAEVSRMIRQSTISQRGKDIMQSVVPFLITKDEPPENAQ